MPGALGEATRVLALLSAAAALACFSDPGIGDPTEGDASVAAGTSTTADPTTGGSASTTNTSATTSTTTGAATSTSSTTTSTSSTTTSTSSTTTSTSSTATTSPPPQCGDGVVDNGEECDDGNLADDDACLATCQVATCDDGVKSQDETDVDCGGVCQPCDLCQACLLPDHCASGECIEGQCSRTFEITIDYVMNCGPPGDGSNDVSIPDLPAGTYRATAKPSAGSYWNLPPNPPQSGWLYLAFCDGFAFEKMRTPPNFFYGTPASAFDNLIAGSEDFTFPGGELRCGFDDTTCFDNMGAVTFLGRRLCP